MQSGMKIGSPILRVKNIDKVLECLILENVYNLACRISYYNAISEIIMPDVLKNPISSDFLCVLGISRTKYSGSRGLVATIV